MSDTKLALQNDNDKNIEEGSVPEQASSNITIDMYAAKNEKKDVCGSVLRKEEEYKAGRTKLIDTEAIDTDICEQGIEYIIFAEHGWKAQQIQTPQEPSPQKQGSWGPPQQQQASWGPPQQQQAGWGPPQQQQAGWGLPQQQQGGWGPPQEGQQPHQQQQATWGRGPATQPQDDGGGMHRARGDIHGAPINYSEVKEDRNRFVRKVMLILLAMLLVTAAMIVIAMTVRPVKVAFRRYALYIAIPPAIILIFLSCFIFSNCARKPPMNYIMLVLAVILESLICMVMTARFSTEIVLIAFAATAGCVGLCVLLACSKFDFTRFLLIVIMVMAALFFISLIQLILHFAFGIYCKWVRLGICIAFTLVHIVLLTIELQMILGGRTVEIGVEDYALGAYLLYTTIVELFQNILNITGIVSS